MNNRIKKLTLLKETKYLSLYNAECENKVGESIHWSIASRKDYNTLKSQYFEGKEDVIDAVVIVAMHKETGKLVLIKQFRIPLNDYVYELPAGLVDHKEPMEQAVARELKEETGLELLEIDFSKTKNKVYISGGMTDESVAMVYCTCGGHISKEYLEVDEDIEAMLVSQEEAKELLSKNLKMDIKTCLVLQHFINCNSGEFI